MLLVVAALCWIVGWRGDDDQSYMRFALSALHSRMSNLIGHHLVHAVVYEYGPIVHIPRHRAWVWQSISG